MAVRKIRANYRSVTGLVADHQSARSTAHESSLERDFIKHLLFNKNVLKHEEQPLTTGPPPSCSLAGLGAALDPVRRGVTVSACTSQKKRISGQGAFSVMV